LYLTIKLRNFCLRQLDVNSRARPPPAAGVLPCSGLFRDPLSQELDASLLGRNVLTRHTCSISTAGQRVYTIWCGSAGACHFPLRSLRCKITRPCC
jgi:hypothetical protein